MIIEYKEVDRVSVTELNDFGQQGWRPGALTMSSGYRAGNDTYVEGGWSGILWREAKKSRTKGKAK